MTRLCLALFVFNYNYIERHREKLGIESFPRLLGVNIYTVHSKCSVHPVRGLAFCQKACHCEWPQLEEHTQPRCYVCQP